jgi:hypothetical protein
MASNQLTQRHVNGFSLRPCTDQLLGFVEHAVIDLDVRSHTPDYTHSKVYSGAKPPDGVERMASNYAKTGLTGRLSKHAPTWERIEELHARRFGSG